MSRRRRQHKKTALPPLLLCIDDQVEYLPVRKAFLESVGYRVATASSGMDGVLFVRTYPVDAVVLDYCMPDMDGGAVAREIRRTHRQVPVILLSGYAGEIPPAVQKTVTAVVPKGLSAVALLEALRAAVPVQPQRRHIPVTTAAIQEMADRVEQNKKKVARQRKTILRAKQR